MDTKTGSDQRESIGSVPLLIDPSIAEYRERLREMIGDVPSGDAFTKRMREHQGWWRAFVLGVPPGPHPTSEDEGAVVCNSISPDCGVDGFLNAEIRGVVTEILANRGENSSGIIEPNRLFYNLLSSQPLCFNFFAPLYRDHALALEILRGFFPRLTAVTRVFFEYAPKERYTGDNSAFDVAIEGREGEDKILIGLECKYTDSFSQKEYKYDTYQTIFDGSKNRWARPYADYTSSQYNQLFRNQLIAEALVMHGHYAKVYTGLFCSEQDPSGEPLKTHSCYEISRT